MDQLSNTPIPQPNQPASPGKHVVLDLLTEDGLERMEFDIVPDEEADFRNGYLGASTPLAKAIQGRKAGQVVPYRVGGAREARIIEVGPARSVPSDAAERRQETIRKAIDQSDRTNAMIFASSFSGKWGDYDPTGFTDEEAGQSPETD